MIFYSESEEAVATGEEELMSGDKRMLAPGALFKLALTFLLLISGGTAFAIHWYQSSDVRVGLTREGCDIMAGGSRPVPVVVTGNDGKCYVEHADISLNSLFDNHMYHIRTVDGEHEFWIQRALVEWIEKNGSRRYTAGK